jgi:hypothetical protein
LRSIPPAISLAQEESKETTVISPERKGEKEEEANDKMDSDDGKGKDPVHPTITKTPLGSKVTINEFTKISYMLILTLSMEMH